MSETTRPCLVCEEGADAHTDPATDDHAYEPANPTAEEAATIVAWIADEQGPEAAAEAARGYAAAGAWFATRDETGSQEAADAAYVAELASDERASILADLADGEAGWQLPAPQRGWVLTEDEEAQLRNAQ